MSKPIDFADMLNHIAAARGLPDPHPAAIDEMTRACNRIRPDAVRAAVREWLDADTTGKLPLPGQIIPIAQRHARTLALADRAPATAFEDLASCPHCDDTKFIFVDDNAVKPCQACIPATYSRWKRGHYHTKHNEASCAECQAMRTTNRPVASAIASEVDLDPEFRTPRRQDPAA